MPLGNDIVDLFDPESAPSARHARFAGRVLAPAELEDVATATDSDRALWSYWAAKESAFKAFRKVDPDLPFSPARFEVFFRPGNDGIVRHGTVQRGHLLAAVEVTQGEQLVHAIARLLPPTDEGPSTLFWQVESGVRLLSTGGGVAPKTSAVTGPRGGVRQCPGVASASMAGRRFLLGRLATRLRCEPADLRVVSPRRRGVAPMVTQRGTPVDADVSLSHHGRWVGFAFALGTGVRSAS